MLKVGTCFYPGRACSVAEIPYNRGGVGLRGMCSLMGLVGVLIRKITIII